MNTAEPHKPQPLDGWTPRRKAIVSALFTFHVFAVFAAPCASPPPASYAWSWLAGRVDGQDGLLTPYLQAAYLNHGYRFFAPNPGPSHLVRYEVELKAGGKIDGRFPDPDEDWPRLLYHRMFMISETVFNLSQAVSEPPSAERPAPPLLQLEPPPTLTEFERQEFLKQRSAARELAQSVARRLIAQNKGTRVRLYVQTHEIPFPADVLAGQALDAPELYRERLLGEFTESNDGHESVPPLAERDRRPAR